MIQGACLPLRVGQFRGWSGIIAAFILHGVEDRLIKYYPEELLTDYITLIKPNLPPLWYIYDLYAQDLSADYKKNGTGKVPLIYEELKQNLEFEPQYEPMAWIKIEGGGQVVIEYIDPASNETPNLATFFLAPGESVDKDSNKR